LNCLEKDGKKEMHEVYTDSEIAAQIDEVLSSMDFNKDGFISYGEFMTNNEPR
jgi:Ca2+-binding EF-hand superfamily protein